MTGLCSGRRPWRLIGLGPALGARGRNLDRRQARCESRRGGPGFARREDLAQDGREVHRPAILNVIDVQAPLAFLDAAVQPFDPGLRLLQIRRPGRDHEDRV